MSLKKRIQEKRGTDWGTTVFRVEFIPELMLNVERGSEEVSAVLRTHKAMWTIVEQVQMQRDLDQEYFTSDLFHIHAAHVCFTLM